MLEDIVLWDIDDQYSVNFGSNGVRDYFRRMAKKVLDSNSAGNKTNNRRRINNPKIQ